MEKKVLMEDTMAYITDVIEQNKKDGKFFKCEECKKKVLSEDIKYVDPADNIEILTPMMPFIFIDKNGKIAGGSKMAKKSLGDKIFACPHCNTIHLYGFDIWEVDNGTTRNS